MGDCLSRLWGSDPSLCNIIYYRPPYLSIGHRVTGFSVTDLPANQPNEEDDNEGGHGNAACQHDEGWTHHLLHQVGRVEHLNLYNCVQDFASVVCKNRNIC